MVSVFDHVFVAHISLFDLFTSAVALRLLSGWGCGCDQRLRKRALGWVFWLKIAGAQGGGTGGGGGGGLRQSRLAAFAFSRR